MSSAKSHLFLDTSVVLAHIVQQNRETLCKWNNDINKYLLVCSVSDSVVNECETKIRQLTDFLGQIGTLITQQISRQRSVDKRSPDEPINGTDLLAVERAFFEAHPVYTAMVKQFAKRPILNLKVVEALIVDFLDRAYRSKEPPTLGEALIQLNALVLKLKADINTKFDSAIRIRHELATPLDITPNPLDVAQLQFIGLRPNDATHVASAKQAERNHHCSKAVFVTFDYATILRYQIDILQKISLWCSDPLYAAYHATI